MAPKHNAKTGARSGPQNNQEDHVFFHKEWDEFGFMSNYTPAKFSAPDPAVVCAAWLVANSPPTSADTLDETPVIEFEHSAQYYMYCKAVCFGDTAAAQRILAASKAGDCKDAARHINGYDDTVWSLDRKLRVMADALWHKFGGAHLQQMAAAGLVTTHGLRCSQILAASFSRRATGH